eukprot:TRINITY_DN7378_c0_g1_i2.p1 TRINITY_DN7378_c0_g1~~TRINITY_DN7378_c0_g1_i2.p1  ORF type:complete len:591 (+),score=95.58 TRINITY_DN7378_c0_g1_i2:167-1939(+)
MDDNFLDRSRRPKPPPYAPRPYNTLRLPSTRKNTSNASLPLSEFFSESNSIAPSTPTSENGNSPHSTVLSPRRHGVFVIEKYGFLKKKGKARHVVLKKGETSDGEHISGCVEWFANSTETKPRGAIERLDDWELSVIGPLTTSYIFKLLTTRNTNRFFKLQTTREYIFICKDNKEMREWVEAIAQVKRIPSLFLNKGLEWKLNDSPATRKQYKTTMMTKEQFTTIKLGDFPEIFIFRLFSLLSESDLRSVSQVSKNLYSAVRKFSLHSNLLQKQDDMRLKVKGVDMNSYLKWDHVLSKGYEYVQANKNRLNKMVSELGVPDDLRPSMWMLFSNADFLRNQDPKLFEKMLQLSVSPDVEAQIRLDIPRTFPSHPDLITETGTTSLNNVLKAFSNSNCAVEYAQGCNFLAGLLITELDDERAYFILVQLMNNYDFQGMYLRGFPGLKKRSFIFDKLFEKQDPILSSHFRSQGVESTMFGPQWFLTLFSNVLPIPLVKRIWDLFFLQGWKAIMQTGLAIFKLDRERLLKLEFEKILLFLRDLEDTYTNNISKCDSLLKLIPFISVKERDMAFYKKEWELSNNVFVPENRKKVI